MPEETQDKVTLDKVVALCKRRGFIFQSSEIYGGLDQPTTTATTAPC